jgi:hypothetical protein
LISVGTYQSKSSALVFKTMKNDVVEFEDFGSGTLIIVESDLAPAQVPKDLLRDRRLSLPAKALFALWSGVIANQHLSDDEEIVKAINATRHRMTP